MTHIRVKKFRSKVTLTTITGEKHVVELVGLEGAVKELAQLIALGVDSRSAGVTREGIMMAKKQAMGLIGRAAREN